MSVRNDDRLRLMCRMRALQGMKIREIAEVVGITPKGVSKALNTPAGRAERERLAAKHERVILAVCLGRLMEELDRVQSKRRSRRRRK